MAISVIVHGPSGCGKSTDAQRIKTLFGLNRISDEWSPGDKVEKQGVLYLTTEEPGRHTGCMVVDYASVKRRLDTPA